MKAIMDKSALNGATAIITAALTPEETQLSTQLFYMLVLLSKDRALALIRNCPENNGAEVWRRLVWEFEPSVGVRYTTILQALLRRKFGDGDEADLVNELKTFERDISKY